MKCTWTANKIHLVKEPAINQVKGLRGKNEW